MMFVSVLAVLVCIAVVASGTAEAVEFQAFLKTHGKSYHSKEDLELRKFIFDMNVLKVEQFNGQEGTTWTAGLNKFSDMTAGELKQYRGYKNVPRSMKKGALEYTPPTRTTAYAPTVDWRNATNPTVLTPVKDQQQCGSCWAFSATASMESAGSIASDADAFILSPQQLVDCSPNLEHCGGTGGCEGSTAELAFKYSADSGVGPAMEVDYPYTAKDGQCQNNVQGIPDYRIQSWTALAANDYDSVMSAIQTQPLSISVDASTWHSYSSGIFSCDMSSPDIDHVVQLVGYGTETTGDDYWIVRNSWGPSWGENGFIRLARQDPTKGDKIPCGMDTTPQDGSGCEHDTKPQKVCGACGMLSDTSFPTATTTMATTK